MMSVTRSTSSTPNNLPQHLSGFVGREQALRDVGHVLETNRLVTLRGTAGCGKTRLALRTAENMLPRYPDGVWFIELALLADPELVPQAVASALGIREEPSRPLAATLGEYLQPLKVLLILDNCEHLLRACALLAYGLLRECPDLSVLATSREALQVTGEASWSVPALSLPGKDLTVAPELVEQFEAVELFVHRVRGHYPQFQITEENATAVVQICRRLDGLPLAIELAAARVQVLAVEQIAARLDERFQLLTTTDYTVPRRQQTLTALLDWSYDLLSDNERALLSKAAIFAGSFTLEAAGALCEGEVTEYEIIDLLSRLVSKSLIVVERHKGEARYRLLETIRHYALTKLTDAVQLAESRSRHRDWYVALAERAQTSLTGSEQLVWLDRLDLEHDNLRAALDWSIKGETNAEAALRLTGAMWRFWDMRGYISEGRAWLSEALALSEDSLVPVNVRAKALNAAGILAAEQDDFEQAKALYEQALEIRRAVGDKQGTAGSLSNLGVVARKREEYDTAIRLYEESLSIFRELKNLGATASVLDNMGLVKQYKGDYEAADAFYGQALNYFTQVEDKQGMSMALNNRGKMMEYMGCYDQARDLYQKALALASELGDRLSLIGVLNNLASLTNREGKPKQAERLYTDNLALCQQLDSKHDSIDCLEGLARAVARPQPERAARLLGAAAMLRDKVGGISMPPIKLSEHEQAITVVCTRLGEEAFKIAWAIGRTMGLDEALMSPPDQTKTKLFDRLTSAFPEPPYPGGLSRREVEVLRMVSAGMADAEVASQLVVSRRTVHSHLYGIYSKIGASSRGEAARFALDNGLL
jgi:predicted ATPase/DNA-binding CsgD family transcriptional regulator